MMNFETGGTFDPAVKNRAGSGATGLNPVHAFHGERTRDLHRCPGKDERRGSVRVRREVFSAVQGQDWHAEGCLHGVLYPKAIGKPEWYPLFTSGTKAYEQNAGLDRDKKGMVTERMRSRWCSAGVGSTSDYGGPGAQP